MCGSVVSLSLSVCECFLFCPSAFWAWVYNTQTARARAYTQVYPQFGWLQYMYVASQFGNKNTAWSGTEYGSAAHSITTTFAILVENVGPFGNGMQTLLFAPKHGKSEFGTFPRTKNSFTFFLMHSFDLSKHKCSYTLSRSRTRNGRNVQAEK